MVDLRSILGMIAIIGVISCSSSKPPSIQDGTGSYDSESKAPVRASDNTQVNPPDRPAEQSPDQPPPTATTPTYSDYRIVIASVRSVFPQYRDACIERLELKINGSWLTNNFTNYNDKLGSYAVTVSASVEGGANCAAYYAFGGRTQNRYWCSGDKYSGDAPFDAVGAPPWLAINFGNDKVTLSGIRVDGGDHTNNTANGECTPDAFYVEGSNDKTTWTEIPGSRQTDVDTTFIKEFNW